MSRAGEVDESLKDELCKRMIWNICRWLNCKTQFKWMNWIASMRLIVWKEMFCIRYTIRNMHYVPGNLFLFVFQSFLIYTLDGDRRYCQITNTVNAIQLWKYGYYHLLTPWCYRALNTIYFTVISSQCLLCTVAHRLLLMVHWRWAPSTDDELSFASSNVPF